MATTKKATKKSPAKKAAPKKPTTTTNEGSALMEFFVDELKDIYWAEKHLTKVLPKMRKACTTESLAEAIENHLAETQTHVERLEQVFEMLGKKAQGKKCDAMAGITEEGSGILEETEDGTATRDVGIVLVCQKVEHYEIATYGGLIQLARTLGEDEVADVLEETLEEEKTADETLTEVAESGINYEAAEEEEDEDEDE